MTEKEFWERCGADLNHKWVNEIGGYQLRGTICLKCHADGGLFGNDDDTCMPELTLDNLFKYAVPKLNNPKITFSFYSSIRDWYCRVQVEKYPFDVALWANQEDHAHVLYNAIVKVFEQEKNDVNR